MSEPAGETRARSRARGCLVFALAIVLLVMVACPLAIGGARRGSLALPWFDRSLAGMHVVGYSTWNANCPPFTGCDPTRHEAYVVWLVAGHTTLDEAPRGYRLINLPLARGVNQ